MQFKAHKYQKTAIDFIIKNKYCGLFLDMGLGKTVSTLTAIKKLRDEYLDVKKVLIIAPKRVAIDTWPAEINKWEHTKDLTYTMLTGGLNERVRGLKTQTDIYITTRDLIKWLVDYVGRDWDFDMVVVDELSSFKGYSSKRFKALKKVRPKCNRLVGLTGTPKPNGYEDLWSQIYLIDRGERLGKNITTYRRTYFRAINYGAFNKYSLMPGMDMFINHKIKDICISMDSKDYLDVKEPMIIDHYVNLDKKELDVYKRLQSDYVLEFKQKEFEALNGASLVGKLKQLANGAIYDENKEYTLIHDKKIEALKEIAESEENILVFYEYKSDLDRLKKTFKDAVVFRDGVIDKWNAGKIKMLLAHPASCGYGLNLQQGGHVIVWFGLSWSLELYLQANARLVRQGQTKPVIIYRILAKDTVDEKIVNVLSDKNYSQKALLNELKHMEV